MNCKVLDQNEITEMVKLMTVNEQTLKTLNRIFKEERVTKDEQEFFLKHFNIELRYAEI